jgi:hypothetical protein
MRSALGSGVFFSPFVPNFSDHVGHLTDMTKDTFNWNNESTWTHDYRLEFEHFKSSLQKACSIYYPNYELDWIVRTDASDLGVGGALLQVNAGTEEIIALASQKFSPQAQSWSTIEKEGYGIYFTVKKFSYYLVGKEFLVQTDHNNLRWIEASEVPKVTRWRIYLQSFSFKIEHYPGKRNILPDTLSRLFSIYEMDDPFGSAYGDYQEYLYGIFDLGEKKIPALKELPADTTSKQPVTTAVVEHYSQDTMFAAVHNSKVGHWGTSYTWKQLNKQFAGHGMSMIQVDNLVKDCVVCQKARSEFKQVMKPITRHLKPPHARSAIGIDALAITPIGKNGMTHINTVVNLFTKFSYLYPISGCTAENLVLSIWHYWCNFGHTDMIVSDLGPDLNSKIFAQLVKLMGMAHKFSIADRHVNGVERNLKEVARHLRAIVFDDRVPDIFENPTIIPSCQHILNTHESSETGFSPFELTFGSDDKAYANVLRHDDPGISHTLLVNLNDNLRLLRKVSTEYQNNLVVKRADKPEDNNVYQPGDFVMLYKGPKPHPKMATRYLGPHEVIVHQQNDVQVRDILTGAVKKLSVHDLKPFFGTLEQAKQAAMRDNDQYEVTKILDYTGDSNRRTAMTFLVQYIDDDIRLVPWSQDLLCDAYYSFCESIPHLHHLTFDVKISQKFISDMKKTDIACASPGDIAYIDLRFFGDLWFEDLALPKVPAKFYVVKFKYIQWFHKTSKKKISAEYLLGGNMYALDTYQVFAWGSILHFDPNTMTLVDESYILTYPKLVE